VCAVFLGKLGLFAYLVKRFVPSLYPLPSNFLTVRPTMGSLLRFWPLYAYCATYYYAQRLLGCVRRACAVLHSPACP
jgi:hypothetical protein